MRVIVFDDETMEPITAITLPKWMTDRLRSGERIRVPYVPQISLADAIAPGDLPPAVPRTWCEIWFEKFVRKGSTHWFCFTGEGEHALNLKSVFLAGQARAVIEREEAAFGRGVLAALTRMYGNDLHK